MKRLLLIPVLAGALIAPATASAKTVTVALPDEYQQAFPAVERVTTVGLPRLTDGYAPRWLVAQSAVGVIQHRAYNGAFPRRIWIRGARWGAGRWRVHYRTVTEGDTWYGRFVLSHDKQRLKFNGYS